MAPGKTPLAASLVGRRWQIFPLTPTREARRGSGDHNSPVRRIRNERGLLLSLGKRCLRRWSSSWSTWESKDGGALFSTSSLALDPTVRKDAASCRANTQTAAKQLQSSSSAGVFSFFERTGLQTRDMKGRAFSPHASSSSHQHSPSITSR